MTTYLDGYESWRKVSRGNIKIFSIVEETEPNASKRIQMIQTTYKGKRYMWVRTTEGNGLEVLRMPWEEITAIYHVYLDDLLMVSSVDSSALLLRKLLSLNDLCE